jgi:hypothetical protein
VQVERALLEWDIFATDVLRGAGAIARV